VKTITLLPLLRYSCVIRGMTAELQGH